MPRFRTTEISDPRFESDNLCFITVKTTKLRGRGDICVFVPAEATTEDLPIVTLLHGVYGSCWCWALKGGAHRTAERLIGAGAIPPCIIAMPSDGLWGDGSGYLPHHGRDFGRWITEDVIDAIRLLIPQARDSRKNFLGGLSMGGYGTLRLAALYPATYAAVSAHSSITRLEEMALFVEEALDDYRQEDQGENVSSLLTQAKALPRLRFDCGTEDELVSGNRRLHQELKEAGVEHTYAEFPGGHEWAYWENHLEDSLRFFFG